MTTTQDIATNSVLLTESTEHYRATDEATHAAQALSTLKLLQNDIAAAQRELLSELLHEHRWTVYALARVSGLNRYTVRKYIDEHDAAASATVEIPD